MLISFGIYTTKSHQGRSPIASNLNFSIILLDHFQKCRNICCLHKLLLVYGYDGCKGTLPWQIHRAGHKIINTTISGCTIDFCLHEIQPCWLSAHHNHCLSGIECKLEWPKPHSLPPTLWHKLAKLKKLQDKCIRSSAWFAMVYFTKIIWKLLDDIAGQNTTLVSAAVL